MTANLWLWYAARIAALAAFFVLAASLLTGVAIRTAYLSVLARNRAILSLHSFLAWFWIPLVGVHVVCLLLDAAAQVHLTDLIVPFQVSAGAGSQLAVGLGTIGLLLLVLLGVTSALRRRIAGRLWLWIHRLGYPMFVVFLLHAQVAGTDFSHTAISLAGWATLGALAMLSLLRMAGGRVAAGTARRVGAQLAAAGDAAQSAQSGQVS